MQNRTFLVLLRPIFGEKRKQPPPPKGNWVQWRIQKILVGGDFKHKTSKIRMSSPKLRVIFRPKSEIQTFFSPKIRWSPKEKEKKVFTKIVSDFSAEIGNSNDFFAQNQVVSKKKRSSPELRVIFSPDSLRLGW